MEQQPGFVRSLISETINNSIQRRRSIAQSPIAVAIRPTSPPVRRRRGLLRVRPVRRRRNTSRGRSNSEPTNSNDTGMEFELSVNDTPAQVNLRDVFGDLFHGPDSLWDNYENIYYDPRSQYDALKREEDQEAEKQRLNSSSRKRKRRRKSKEPVYDEDEDNACAINGTEECDGKNLVTLNCGCKSMCKSCALQWLKNSSSCPFCRKPINTYVEEGKRARNVQAVQQRSDHDLSINYYTFSYFNRSNIKITHDLILQESYIFANERSTNVSKEVLIYLQLLSSSLQNRFVMPVDAILEFLDILFSKISRIGIYHQLLFRATVYYALYSPSDFMLGKAATLLGMLVERVKKKRLKAKKQDTKWHVDLFHDKQITISPQVFRSTPLNKLFSTSIANLILHAHKANLYRPIVIDKIIDIEPNIIYIMAAADDFMNPQVVDLT